MLTIEVVIISIIQKNDSEIRDVVYLETTNVVILYEQTKLLEDNDSLPTSKININNKDINMEDVRNYENDQISGSKRKRQPSQWLKDHYIFASEEINQLHDDPKIFKDAMNKMDFKEWEEAMKDEYSLKHIKFGNQLIYLKEESL